ncbi:MAG: hypothetical protein ACLR2E_04485 [Lachnospiraceae bacterium]
MDIEIKEPLSTEEAVRRLDAVRERGHADSRFPSDSRGKSQQRHGACGRCRLPDPFPGGLRSRIWTGKSLYTAFLEQPSISIIKKTKKAGQSWISAR